MYQRLPFEGSLWIQRRSSGGVIGTNRRYAESIEIRSLEKLNLQEMVGHPETLGQFEIDLEHKLLIRDPKPKKARAWVRYSGRAMRVNVYVLAWTAQAVRVRWVTGDGQRQEAWGWSPAVRELPWVQLN